MSAEPDKVEDQIEKAVKRLERAQQERSTMLAQTAYIGILGLLFVLPVIGGAYLGVWIDSRFEGYSVGWTLGLSVLGIVIGAVNVYYFVRD